MLERIAKDDARARAYLRALWGVHGRPESAADVLALLDACAGRLVETRVIMWPASGDRLRLVAAREGDDWGLALEQIKGTRPTGLLAAQVVIWAFGSRVKGAVPGATQRARPVPDFGAADLDARLGPPSLVLPQLGLSADATVVGSVAPFVLPTVPSSDPTLRELASRLRTG
jgi:hypothetical protein